MASSRTMDDALGEHASAIPRTAQMVAGYVDGDFAWSAADWARFPHSAHVGITVAGSAPHPLLASVVDVETGAFTALQSRGFVIARNDFRPGGLATVYCNLSTLPAVRRSCRGLIYGLWIAHYTSEPPPAPDPQWGPGVVAVQWKDGDTTGTLYDSSVVFDPKWHPQP